MTEIYEHQLELNKCKIQMLEKTCINYQNGLNDLNRSSDYLINLDKNISTYKAIIDDLQKQNVQLETERIELNVKCNQYQEDINRFEFVAYYLPSLSIKDLRVLKLVKGK